MTRTVKTYATQCGDVLLGTASAVGFFLIIASITAHIMGVHILMFLTGSMSPTIPPGAATIAIETPASSLAPGDVVSLREDTLPLPISHRIVDITPTGTGLFAVTMQGDANPTEDFTTYYIDSAPRHIWVVPHASTIVSTFGSRKSLYFSFIVFGSAMAWSLWPRSATAPVTASAP